MLHLKGILCVLLALLPAHSQGASLAVVTLIKQTHDLAIFLQGQTSLLLTTYLEQMGSPFSDPEFSMTGVQLEGLPVAAISYITWRRFGTQARLAANYQAYTIFREFLQLVLDDQLALGPGPLQEQLTFAKAQAEGLLANVGSLMLALGYQLPAVDDPLTSASYDPTNFERKLRGYIVCRQYQDWIDRTERDFKLLSYYYRA